MLPNTGHFYLMRDFTYHDPNKDDKDETRNGYKY